MTVDELVERLLEHPPWREVAVVVLDHEGQVPDVPQLAQVDHIEEVGRDSTVCVELRVCPPEPEDEHW